MSKHHRPDQRPTPQLAPPPGAWWNNIRRAWFISGESGPVALDPPPPPPLALGRSGVSRGSPFMGGQIPVSPAVKVIL